MRRRAHAVAQEDEIDGPLREEPRGLEERAGARPVHEEDEVARDEAQGRRGRSDAVHPQAVAFGRDEDVGAAERARLADHAERGGNQPGDEERHQKRPRQGASP